MWYFFLDSFVTTSPVLELYTDAASTIGFAGKILRVWCDNESAMAIINIGHSKEPRVMDLIRFVVLISMKQLFGTGSPCSGGK